MFFIFESIFADDVSGVPTQVSTGFDCKKRTANFFKIYSADED